MSCNRLSISAIFACIFLSENMSDTLLLKASKIDVYADRRVDV